jgi:serpin B
MRPLLALLALHLAACGPDPDPRIYDNDDGDVGIMARDHADFGFELLRQLRADGDAGNLIMSPMSISAAFAMTELGARGDTQAQMRDTLNITLDEQTYHPLFGGLMQDLGGEHNRDYELAIANRLFAQQDFPLEQPFLDQCASDYGAPVEQLDFAADPDGSRSHINDWVMDNTRDKIEELLPSGSISPATRLVLVNAIAFLADWKTKFKAKNTEDAPFTLEDGSTVTVPLMTGVVDANLGFDEDEGLLTLQLPYGGDELSFVVLMPEDPAELGALEQSLTADRVGDLIDATSRDEELQVWLPRFELEWDQRLKAPLQAMGMALPFGGSADFSGMTSESVYVDEAYHKAYIRVDEAGTEAAAATAVVVDLTSAGPEPRIDSPFVYLIRDDLTGSVLFMGRVVDPSTAPVVE